MSNMKYIFTPPGVLKTASLILGLIVTCIIGHAYDRSFYNNTYKALVASQMNLHSDTENMGKESFFLSIAVICFLMSLAFYICHIITEELSRTPANQFFDAGYHALGAILMFIGACLVISSAVNINKLEKRLPVKPDYKYQYKSEKIAAGVFGLINSLIYGLTAWLTFIGNPQPAE